MKITKNRSKHICEIPEKGSTIAQCPKSEREGIASVIESRPTGKYKNHSYGQNKIASQITRCSSAENLLAINMKFSDFTGFKTAIGRERTPI